MGKSEEEKQIMIIKMVLSRKCSSGDNNYWRDRRTR